MLLRFRRRCARDWVPLAHIKVCACKSEHFYLKLAFTHTDVALVLDLQLEMLTALDDVAQRLFRGGADVVAVQV